MDKLTVDLIVEGQITGQLAVERDAAAVGKMIIELCTDPKTTVCVKCQPTPPTDQPVASF
jgi:hypothetical protein